MKTHGHGVPRVKRLYRRILDLVYPTFCCMCGERAEKSRLPLCEHCAKAFSETLTKDCPKCGYKRRDCVCEKSDKTVFLFYYHSKEEKNAVTSLKKHPDRRTGKFWGKLLAEKILLTKAMGFDCVTYVPRKKSSARRYGGDQARLIAAGVAEGLGTKAVTLLKRSKFNRNDQKLLDAAQRRKNVKNTFFATDKAPLYRRVLLVDDVTTTGSTIEECASVLRAAGVNQVITATLARTP